MVQKVSHNRLINIEKKDHYKTFNGFAKKCQKIYSKGLPNSLEENGICGAQPAGSIRQCPDNPNT
jgi:hypothetical protein